MSYGREAMRLLREKWDSPNDLAEELFAILSNPDIAETFNAPLTLTKADNATQPAIETQGFSLGDVFIQFGNDDGSDSELSFGDLLFGFQNAGGGQQQASTSTFMGSVVSGTGATYSVLLDSGVTVTAIQQQIAVGETIPVGTFTVVVKGADGIYRMQVPVWL